MKILRAIVFLLSVLLVKEWGSAQNATTTTVEGHVIKQDGSPVRDANVEVHPFGPFEGILPDPVHTNEQGFFRIVFPAMGQAWVTASKVDEGYPNAALAIYGRGGYNSLKEIYLKAGGILNVELRFGEPNATISIAVVDSLGNPISTARILIEWPDNADYMTSNTIPSDGIFKFVLPAHTVSITVSAPGFKVWRYKDQKTGAPSLAAAKGSHLQLKAVLFPTGTR